MSYYLKESNERLEVVLKDAWDKVKNKFEDCLNDTGQHPVNEFKDAGQQLDKDVDDFAQKRKNHILHRNGNEAEHTLKEFQYNLVDPLGQAGILRNRKNVPTLIKAAMSLATPPQSKSPPVATLFRTILISTPTSALTDSIVVTRIFLTSTTAEMATFTSSSTLTVAEQALCQQQVAYESENKKALTDFLHDLGNLVSSASEDGLQTRGVLSGSLGVARLDATFPTAISSGFCVKRGRGCRAEEAKAEGDECEESERAHGE